MRHLHFLVLPGVALLAAVGSWVVFSFVESTGDRVVAQSNPSAMADTATRMNGAQPLLPPSVLTLTGDVLELAAGAPLAVTAIVGTDVYQATVTGHSYSVRIGRPSSDQLVLVEARSPRVHYRSVVGSAGLLRSLAGPDSIVEPSESPSVRISPYSTALGWLVRHALGGREAASDVEFERMTRVAASSDLEYAAYALAGIAKEELELPAAYADGFELLRDRAAFSQITRYGTFRLAADGYLFRQSQAAAISPSEGLPEQLAFVDGMPRDQLPIYPGDVFLLSRRLDGNFEFEERLPLLEPVHGLDLDGEGRLQLTPFGSQVRTLQKFEQNPQGEFFERRAVGRTLKRLTRGNETSVWAMRSVWSDQSLDNPATPAAQVSEYRVLSSTELANWSSADGWAAIVGSTVALPWMCAESQPEEMVYDLSKCGMYEHRFEDGSTGRTLDHGWKVTPDLTSPLPTRTESFQWTAGSHGAVEISDSKVLTSFWRLKGYPASVSPVFYRSTALAGDWSGRSTVGIDVAATRNLGTWAAAAMQGEWESGTPDWLPNGYSSQSYSTLLERFADGTGRDVQTPNLPYCYPLWWQSSNDLAYQSRVRAYYYNGQPGPPYVADCKDALAVGADGCLIRAWTFKPIYRIGNRYYGVEDTYAGLVSTDPVEASYSRQSSTLVYYECKSGQCASMSPEAGRPSTLPPPRRSANVRLTDAPAGQMRVRDTRGMIR